MAAPESSNCSPASSTSAVPESDSSSEEVGALEVGPDGRTERRADVSIKVRDYLAKYLAGKPDRVIAICAVVISLFALGFAGWQGYEAHQANHAAAQANEEARVANQEARTANSIARDSQQKQFEQQKQVIDQQQRTVDEQDRALAEYVYVDRASPEIQAAYPDVEWVVKNLNSRQYITAVWLDMPNSNGGSTVWKLGEVGPCQAVGIKFSRGYNPRYVYFLDGDGQRWKRLNRTWSTGSKAMHVPEPTDDKGPAEGDYSTHPFEIPGCSVG
jgi:hypothetical protein